ncbi:DCB domain-containing protein [Trichostrongylus colubriformis]|uniref:DCB domain-containing protein n=1 Tax=Trichostrongylus colubriformis TaxID=6319 RepID=A0AAN8IY52_TRICO
MVCSVDLRVSLQEVEECLELCMRVFGSTREEAVRVSARAAVSQSITTYCSNRYAAGEESQNVLSVYLDVTKLLESYIAKLDQLTVSSDQSVVLFDAMNALLSAQPLSVQRHTPLVNLLWEKLCPLMIRLLGVPDKNVPGNPSISTEEPLGQGQMAKFTLSPAVVANPEATRVLYQILEQLIRIMAGIPSVNSVLEALFHKAFLFPKIEQRAEAVRIIKKILSDRQRLNDIISSCVRSRSLSLWRMLIVCVAECAQPQYEIAIEALQGVLTYCESSDLLDEEIRWKLKEMFPTLADVNPPSTS